MSNSLLRGSIVRLPVAPRRLKRQIKATQAESVAPHHVYVSDIKDTEPLISRRMALSSLVTASSLLVPGLPVFADDEQVAEGATLNGASSQEFPAPSTSYVADFPDDGVPSNLRPNEYYRLLFQLRPICWAAIARSLQTKDYDRLSLAMNQAPIADLRSAAKFTPWSLLQADEYEAAVASRKAFVDLETHMKDLSQIAEATAMNGAQPEQVQQAFILLNASFEQFIATMPSRFQ